MTLPPLKDWLFSARSFAAAMLALYLALLARPAAALLGGRHGLYRHPAILGRLACQGAGALPRHPGGRRLRGRRRAESGRRAAAAGAGAGALGRGLHHGLALDPTPRSYAFRLAGFTAALIAFPSVDAPGTIFDTALARIEEIGLGILCVTLVDQVFPRPATPVLLARLEAWIGGMARFGADALSGRMEAGRFLAERRRVARDGAALDSLFEEARYEAGGHRTGLAWVRALRARARTVPAMISAVADRAHALRRDDPAAASCSSGAALAPLLQEAAAWLAATADPARRGAARAAAPALLGRLQAAERAAAAGGDWSCLLREGLLARLGELVETWSRALALEPRAGRLAPAPREAAAPVTSFHVDPLLVGLTGLSVVVAVLACDLAWVATGWPEGGTATMMAAVATAMFAQLDDPAPAIASFLGWTTLSVLVAAAYLFAVLPAIDGFPLLAFALAVLYLPFGALHAQPARVGIALPVMVNTVALISLQEVYAAEFAAYVNGALALLAGFAAGLVSTRLVRAFGVDLAAAPAGRRRPARPGAADRGAAGRPPPQRRRHAGSLRIPRRPDRLGRCRDTRRDGAGGAARRDQRDAAAGGDAAAAPGPGAAAAAALAAVAALARGPRRELGGDQAAPEAVLARLDAALGACMGGRGPAGRARGAGAVRPAPRPVPRRRAAGAAAAKGMEQAA